MQKDILGQWRVGVAAVPCKKLHLEYAMRTDETVDWQGHPCCSHTLLRHLRVKNGHRLDCDSMSKASPLFCSVTTSHRPLSSPGAVRLRSMPATGTPPQPQILVCVCAPTEAKFVKLLADTGMNVATVDETIDPAAVLFAVLHKHPHGMLKRFPNLKGVQLVSAGVDHVLRDKEFPRHVPVARVVEQVMTERMAAWVLWAVLNSHLEMDFYGRAQSERHWARHRQSETVGVETSSVGIMGLGVMGSSAAKKLRGAGYSIRGWSRTPKAVEGVECFHGKDQLHNFLKGSNFLVCLLPLTEETKGIVNRTTLSALPAGSTFINGGRGDHVVEQDLLWALDTGHINHCVLDVFSEEPLPESSPLWNHPGVRITPHVAALTSISTTIDQIVENHRRCMNGEAMLNTVDFDVGY